MAPCEYVNYSHYITAFAGIQREKPEEFVEKWTVFLEAHSILCLKVESNTNANEFLKKSVVIETDGCYNESGN